MAPTAKLSPSRMSIPLRNTRSTDLEEMLQPSIRCNRPSISISRRATRLKRYEPLAGVSRRPMPDIDTRAGSWVS